MNYKSFAERTKDKTFDELVHEGKRRAHELIDEDDNRQMLVEMELKAQLRFREWCIEGGINPDEISEEQVIPIWGCNFQLSNQNNP